MYDILIIGSGISGATLANTLSKKYSVAVIEKGDGTGGVWRQTKWSWLKSDTTSLLYSPTNAIGKSWVQKYKSSGVPRADILQLTEAYVKNADVHYNCTVSSCMWSDNKWDVYTDKRTFTGKWLIDCTGLYQTPHIPDFAKQIPSTVRVVHSSAFTDEDSDALSINNQKIAVIGSRESGVQIIQGLYTKGFHDVDWYGRSFANWYSAIDRTSKILQLASFAVSLLPCWIWKTVRTFLHNKMMHWMVDVCLKQISQKIIPLLPESYYKYGFMYHWSQPFRPVFTFGTNIKDVNRITMDDMSKVPFEKYDVIILATGFTQQPMFDIRVNGEEKTIDLFRLVNYIHPRDIPNMLVCKPLAVSSWVILESLVNKCEATIEKHMQKHRHTTQPYIVSQQQYEEYSKKQDELLKKIGMDEKMLTFHARAKTFVYINEFM